MDAMITFAMFVPSRCLKVRHPKEQTMLRALCGGAAIKREEN